MYTKYGRFIFKGADGSMGFKNGNIYALEVVFGNGKTVDIFEQGGFRFCPYSSYEKFMENWSVYQPAIERTDIEQKTVEVTTQFDLNVNLGKNSSISTVMTHKKNKNTVAFSRLGDLSDRDLTRDQMKNIIEVLDHGLSLLD